MIAIPVLQFQTHFQLPRIVNPGKIYLYEDLFFRKAKAEFSLISEYIYRYFSRINKKCEGEDEIRYEANGKCYQPGPFIPGIDSPCADDFEQFVELYEKPGYGECFCVDYKDTTYRPVVHWEKSNRCYWLYDQVGF